MAQRTLNLLADTNTGRLIASPAATVSGVLPPLIFGDSVPLNVRLVEPNPGGGIDAPWRDIDLDGKTIRVGIGQPGGKPSSGTFTLTYGANTTASLPFNATAAQVATALNALASIISAGGVTVAGTTGGYRIAFVSSGARTAITADTDALYPASQFVAIIAQEGDAGTEEVVLGTLKTQPAAYSELTEIPDAPSVAVSTIQEGVISEVSFTLTYKGQTTDPLALTATNSEIALAINALSEVTTDGGVTVSGVVDLTSAGFVTRRTLSVRFVSSFTLDEEDWSFDFTDLAAEARQDISSGSVSGKPYIQFSVYPIQKVGIQQLAISGVAIGGTYRLSYEGALTRQIQLAATADDLESAVGEIAPAGTRVTRSSATSYEITFPLKTDDLLLEVGDDSLLPPSWRTGDLSLNTTGIIELLAGKSSASAQFEIEVYDEATSDSWTVFQGACTLRDEIIPSSPASQTGGPSYLTAGAIAAMATPLDVEDDAEKLDLSPVAGQLVRITGEADRIEQFLGGDASEQTSWLVLRNTVDLLVENGLADDIEINGVVIAAESGPTAVGWVDPLNIAADMGEQNANSVSVYQYPSENRVTSDASYSTALAGTITIPTVVQPRSAVWLFIDNI